MTFYVFRRRRTVGGKVRQARTYTGRYRLDGMEQPKEVALGVTDKQVAERKLREIVDEVQRERAGLIQPRAMRDGLGRALGKHLEDYLADLGARGKDAKYRENVGRWVRRLMAECGWRTVGDVRADGFVTWRSKQGAMAARTRNHYLAAMRGFLAWLVRNERIEANPLERVVKVDERGRQVRARRALTDAELARLMTVAGPRRVFYLAAVHTGFRFSELRQLQWADVTLDGDAPRAVARGSTTKNGKEAPMPLHPELVEALRALKREGEGEGRVFGGETVPTRYTRRSDYVRAGIAERDERGLVADFHSLRHTFATRLQVAGVSQRVAMEAMRHSDARLTMNVYTDANALPVRQAIEGLPSIGGWTAIGTLDRVPEGREASSDGTTGREGWSEKTPDSMRVSRDLAHAGATGQRQDDGSPCARDFITSRIESGERIPLRWTSSVIQPGGAALRFGCPQQTESRHASALSHSDTR